MERSVTHDVADRAMPATVVRSIASPRAATATTTAMRRTMSTMTNQTARRGGFFNRVYQVATVTVAGAGTDAVRAVCSAPATAFRQGMPLVVDYGDCSDAPEAEAVRAHLGLLRDAQLLPLGVSNVSSELSRELAAAGVPTLFSSGAKPGGDGGRAARRPAARAEPEPPPPPKPKSSSAASAAAATTQLALRQRAVGRAGVRRGREPVRARRRAQRRRGARRRRRLRERRPQRPRALRPRRPRHGAADRRRPLQRRARLGGGRLPARRLGARAHRPKSARSRSRSAARRSSSSRTASSASPSRSCACRGGAWSAAKRTYKLGSVVATVPVIVAVTVPVISVIAVVVAVAVAVLPRVLEALRAAAGGRARAHAPRTRGNCRCLT